MFCSEEKPALEMSAFRKVAEVNLPCRLYSQFRLILPH